MSNLGEYDPDEGCDPPDREMERVDFSALDDSPEALAAADHNFRILRDAWCKCGNQGDVGERMAYYRDAVSGSHGWMCAECFGIVQTG